MPPRIACVLNPSNEYDLEYVIRLRDGIARKTKHFEFFPIIERRWPGWWCKMALFEPHIKGDLLYFDLDTVIADDLSDIFAVKKLTVLSDFNKPEIMASGMMFIPEAERAAVWEEWIKDPQKHIADRGKYFGDGGFLGRFWGNAHRWQDVLPGQVVSYKKHVRGKGIPPEARVICFHGKPRPRDVNWKVP